VSAVCEWQRMVEKIKKQNEQADDLMEQQDDMIANYKVRCFIFFFPSLCFLTCLLSVFPVTRNSVDVARFGQKKSS
jgi:hypothetical protein